MYYHAPLYLLELIFLKRHRLYLLLYMNFSLVFPCSNFSVDLNHYTCAALRGQLTTRLASQTPVVAVVAIMGTTEEGAVDPLNEILALRDEFRLKVVADYTGRTEQQNKSKIEQNRIE